MAPDQPEALLTAKIKPADRRVAIGYSHIEQPLNGRARPDAVTQGIGDYVWTKDGECKQIIAISPSGDVAVDTKLVGQWGLPGNPHHKPGRLQPDYQSTYTPRGSCVAHKKH